MDEFGFEARLRHLEHVLSGGAQQPVINNKTTILKRIESIRKELHSVYKSNKTIHDFMDKYEVHSKLLNPCSSTLALEREILAPETKLELVLAAADDLERFAADVKQVKALEHVVNGTDFVAVEKLGPELAPLEAIHAEQVKQLEDVTQKITHAMESYNGLVNTLSEIFISWDDILTTMETHVAALERQKAANQS